jgi:hypothetical protein
MSQRLRDMISGEKSVLETEDNEAAMLRAVL